MWYPKISTVIVTLCFLSGLAAETTGHEEDKELAEFIKPWEEMSLIGSDKSSSAYLAADWYLLTKWSRFEEKCNNSKLLQQDMKLYAEEFERIFPSSGSLSLNLSASLKLRELAINFFSGLIFCPQLRFADNMDVLLDLEAIFAKEMIKRISVYVQLERRPNKNASDISSCWRGMYDHENPLFDHMLMRLSPISGTCYLNRENRRCFMNAVKGESEEVRQKFKIWLSPPLEKPYCENYDRM